MRRLLLIALSIVAFASAVAKDSYLPLSTKDKEYIYVSHITKDTIRLPLDFIFESIPIEGVNDHVCWIGQEGWRMILLQHGEGDYPQQRDSIISTVFKKIDGECVYFDYNMQVGDTLNVYESEDTPTGGDNNVFTYIVRGKHIKVLSIEEVIYNNIPRKKYNLESKQIEYAIFFETEPYWQKFIKDDFVEEVAYNESWIEGIGYTTEYYGTYTLQCVFEKGELIYCADGAKCNGLSEVANKKIDFSTLTLHRQGDMLMAVFPAAEPGEAITLYDASGRVVAKQAIRAGATTAGIDASSLPAGIYIATLTSGASAKVAL